MPAYSCVWVAKVIESNAESRETDRQTDRQTDGQTDRFICTRAHTYLRTLYITA